MIAEGRDVPPEEGLEDVPPPLTHDVGYVIRTRAHFQKHGRYPEAGAYNDQDPDLMMDWYTIDLYESRIEQGIYTQMRVPDTASNWLSSMEG